MMSEHHVPSSTLPGAARTNAVRHTLGWTWRAISVRLRFIAVFLAAASVIAGWDVIRNHWDKLIRGATTLDPASQIVSGDTEYFCPMDPGVVGDWPAKCPICNMALVRRTRGDATPLPEGVIARMQFSPYRLQLAGISTSPVEYRPLARDVEGPGRILNAVDGTTNIQVELFADEIAGLAEGQEALVLDASPDPLRARVRAIESQPDSGKVVVILHLADPALRLPPGKSVRGRFSIPVAETEPFRSLSVEPPALQPGERRRVYTCMEHPTRVSETPGKCPTDGRELGRVDLAPNQRLRWWCPMHPNVTADTPGHQCAECGGMTLVPRIVNYGPKGQVLSIPEGAVINTGTRTVAYVERMPGMFDGVEVVLGPRCGDAYPVLRGLDPGQRVVTAGAFLVDAETRLNPSLAASYFGAGTRAEVATNPTVKTDGLSPEDRALVERQKTCPVTGKPLGSMGTPERLEVEGRVVFICCSGCESKLRKDPARYLAKLAADASEPKSSP